MVFSKIGKVFGKGGGEGENDNPAQHRFDSHHIEASQVGTSLVVLVRCEHVSEREATIIYDETDALLDDHTVHVVVDMTHVEVLTSAGIGTLVRLHKRAEDRGGKLAVCSLNDELAELFKLTRMDRLFILKADRAAALGAVRA